MNTKALIDILEDHDLSVALAENETELVVACPLCFSEERKLYIAADTGAWLCFKCDERGGLRDLLLNVCEMPANEAYPTEMSLLAGKKQVPGLIVSRPAPAATVSLPKGFFPLTTDLAGRGTSAAQYLESRGVDLTRAVYEGIGFCLTGYYKHRVIIPVFTQGAMRTFVARSWLNDAKKKVLMPAGSQAERALFGYDQLITHRSRWQDIILVEGVFDAMRMWRAGYGEAVATLGAHVTELQRNLVKRLKPRYVVLLRDADDAGRDAAIKDAKALSEAMLDVKIANLPDGVDPDSATDTNILDAIQSARPVTHQLGIEAMKEAHSGN
ncbi:hypothetical protein LCGC14_0288760 [marine sediment metagenome]|uniref:Toprim domain-containing protein n=1 Tax=marine sediment metagenome TaxID=412755 RepID=A0A0F9TYN7_9ZZZZ